MNLFPNAKVVSDGESTKIVLENIGQVVVPPLYVEQTKASTDKNLTFGIRPEHLEDIALLPSDEQGVSAIDAPVDVVENLGSELLVYMTASGKQMVARLNPRSDAHPGGSIRLHVDNTHIHLFDTDSGKAIF